jgi:hypothetical protein
MIDPFFEQVRDGEWNACVGPQGDELNYISGYLEAARLLADAVIERRLYASRDTLALPILYNVRHGLELGLKFVLSEFVRIDLARPREGQADHNILEYWSQLRAHRICDRAARELIEAIGPFVRSLSRVDDDGQELRYFETMAGRRSLEDIPVVNLPRIRASVAELAAMLNELLDCVHRLTREHVTKTRTPYCSRTDLVEIAGMVGDRATWKEESFLRRKADVKERFQIGSAGFSTALKAIEGSRELAASIGIETPLTYLSDERAERVASRWLEDNRPPPLDAVGSIVSARDLRRELFASGGRRGKTLVADVIEKLTLEEFADLQTLFYIGRDRRFGEEYDENLAHAIEAHRRSDRGEVIDHILSKTNFLDELIRGARIAGRPVLSDRLAGLQTETRSSRRD